MAKKKKKKTFTFHPLVWTLCSNLLSPKFSTQFSPPTSTLCSEITSRRHFLPSKALPCGPKSLQVGPVLTSLPCFSPKSISIEIARSRLHHAIRRAVERLPSTEPPPRLPRAASAPLRRAFPSAAAGLGRRGPHRQADLGRRQRPPRPDPMPRRAAAAACALVVVAVLQALALHRQRWLLLLHLHPAVRRRRCRLLADAPAAAGPVRPGRTAGGSRPPRAARQADLDRRGVLRRALSTRASSTRGWARPGAASRKRARRGVGAAGSSTLAGASRPDLRRAREHAPRLHRAFPPLLHRAAPLHRAIRRAVERLPTTALPSRLPRAASAPLRRALLRRAPREVA
jgi:hypothetical protein